MRYLYEIDSPDKLKELDIKALKLLAKEIRSFLVQSISKTGGHLASNLGVVELTIALHFCLDCPNDKIIWDVGHQSYVHKILTGRIDGFQKLRKKDGMSGFPKTEESKFDAFNTGHSSTSISAALGIATANELSGVNNSVVAVIGDGSMTGGLVYEALNNAKRTNSNLIIILNDNQMAISKNVGSMGKYLSVLRAAPKYLEVKDDVKKVFNHVPVIGKGVYKVLEKTKDSLRYALLSGSMFEDLGIKHIGPIDGHNIAEMISVLTQLKKVRGPVLLHVLTTKGKGYSQAERAPIEFHGVGCFDVKTGVSANQNKAETYSDAFGEKLIQLAGQNKKIVAISAAMLEGTGLKNFAELYPERMFDVGIAESHAVTFAAGLAIQGYIPVFAVYSTFLQRSYDQIVHDVCLQNLHVVFAIDRAGIVGEDGETHQGIFDLSFLSHIPNMTILAPKDKQELQEMLDYAIHVHNGPIAIRYPRGEVASTDESTRKIVYPKSEIRNLGNTIAIVSVGTMFSIAQNVYDRLVIEGYNPTLVNARFVKPIDEALLDLFKDHSHIFTIEDNVCAGGYGSCLRERFAEQFVSDKIIHSFAFRDTFVVQGSKQQLFEQYGLDEDTICHAIIELYEKTRKKI